MSNFLCSTKVAAAIPSHVHHGALQAHSTEPSVQTCTGLSPYGVLKEKRHRNEACPQRDTHSTEWELSVTSAMCYHGQIQRNKL